eukprot:jgi/Orpsp1_1/1188364/evm.model.d7180000064205.1
MKSNKNCSNFDKKIKNLTILSQLKNNYVRWLVKQICVFSIKNVQLKKEINNICNKKKVLNNEIKLIQNYSLWLKYKKILNEEKKLKDLKNELSKKQKKNKNKNEHVNLALFIERIIKKQYGIIKKEQLIENIDKLIKKIRKRVKEEKKNKTNNLIAKFEQAKIPDMGNQQLTKKEIKNYITTLEQMIETEVNSSEILNRDTLINKIENRLSRFIKRETKVKQYLLNAFDQIISNVIIKKETVKQIKQMELQIDETETETERLLLEKNEQKKIIKKLKNEGKAIEKAQQQLNEKFKRINSELSKIPKNKNYSCLLEKLETRELLTKQKQEL